MSDYGGEDYDDDYGDDWLYVEDEYMQADDLAEHAVASPPPIAYDEDQLEEWDRFDYFNDLEYDFEGYDDANFMLHKQQTGQPKVGQKRKRGVAVGHSKKKQRMSNVDGKPAVDVAWLTNSPIIWRAQGDRNAKSRPLPENAEPYAILKDWRQKLDTAPGWFKTPSRTPRELRASPQEPTAITSESNVPGEEEDWEDDEVVDEGEGEVEEAGDEEESGIDSAAIMAALQSRLASAGDPLSGMDPQQLLQFALRMANGEGEGDDIAGEMADEMLNQGGEDDDDEDAEANLLSWVTQQRGVNTNEADSVGKASASISADAASGNQHPPTPPSSQAQRNVNVVDETMTDANPEANNAAAFEQNSALEVEKTSHSLEINQTSRKRKADSTTDSGSASPKKRAARSYDEPTAASQAKAGPAKVTRSGRVRR